jgi:hypothetical protein
MAIDRTSNNTNIQFPPSSQPQACARSIIEEAALYPRTSFHGDTIIQSLTPNIPAYAKHGTS